jgi:Carboxypeptidase regulatory-like domain
MRNAFLFAFPIIFVSAGVAQDQGGRIEGVVVDAASHQPVKKATVSLNSAVMRHQGVTGSTIGAPQADGPQTIITDVSGTFVFDNLPAGQYPISIIDQNYPQGRMGGVHKTVQVSAGSTSSITVELVPGASVTGHILDEDGDPLDGCFVQLHPAGNANQGVPMTGPLPASRDDGSYRLYGIPPGKYIMSSQCGARVFEPRPLSDGPDPPPTAAYPPEYYPATSDPKSAQIVELAPGEEKSGIDFQMRPVSVTQIHGTIAPGEADWHGRNDLRVQLFPLDPQPPGGSVGGSQINSEDGSFTIRQVFPGSYRLVIFTQNYRPGLVVRGITASEQDTSDRIGAVMRVDVADKPIEVSVQLHRAIDITGTVEIESSPNNANRPITPSQLNIQLTSDTAFIGPPSFTQLQEDGSFTIKSVLPGEWRIRLQGPFVFLKSAWLGSEDITHKPIDLTSGAAAPLRIVASTNTATIRGTAPPGQQVFARLEDNDPQTSWTSNLVDPNGQFTFQGLAPGKYRISVGDAGSPMPEEGGQEVTVGEGEIATTDIKPEARP